MWLLTNIILNKRKHFKTRLLLWFQIRKKGLRTFCKKCYNFVRVHNFTERPGSLIDLCFWIYTWLWELFIPPSNPLLHVGHEAILSWSFDENLYSISTAVSLKSTQFMSHYFAANCNISPTTTDESLVSKQFLSLNLLKFFLKSHNKDEQEDVIFSFFM